MVLYVPRESDIIRGQGGGEEGLNPGRQAILDCRNGGSKFRAVGMSMDAFTYSLTGPSMFGQQ